MNKASEPPRLSERVCFSVESMYRPEDRLVGRRACYDEIALHQEGEGRSVYLTPRQARRFAWSLLRESLRRIP